ncbi:MAG: hypothetical protein ACYSVY_29110, partial [Planctomycetota bacterium]
EADLTHHVGEVPDFATIRAEVQRLREIGHQTGEQVPETARQLGELEHQIVQADLASRVDLISATMKDQGVANDESE